MIYLDSCALVKLIRDEDESAALRAWLDEQGDELLVTSELAEAEVVRAIRRAGHSNQGTVADPAMLARQLEAATDVLADVDQLLLDRTILLMAGRLEAPMVRTLDAIHLVSALEVNINETRFVTYDRRLAAAAQDAGLTVIAPA